MASDLAQIFRVFVPGKDEIGNVMVVLLESPTTNGYCDISPFAQQVLLLPTVHGLWKDWAFSQALSVEHLLKETDPSLLGFSECFCYMEHAQSGKQQPLRALGLGPQRKLQERAALLGLTLSRLLSCESAEKAYPYYCGAGQVFEKEVQKALQMEPIKIRPSNAFPVRGGMPPTAQHGNVFAKVAAKNGTMHGGSNMRPVPAKAATAVIAKNGMMHGGSNMRPVPAKAATAVIAKNGMMPQRQYVPAKAVPPTAKKRMMPQRQYVPAEAVPATAKKGIMLSARMEEVLTKRWQNIEKWNQARFVSTPIGLNDLQDFEPLGPETVAEILEMARDVLRQEAAKLGERRIMMDLTGSYRPWPGIVQGHRAKSKMDGILAFRIVMDEEILDPNGGPLVFFEVDLGDQCIAFHSLDRFHEDLPKPRSSTAGGSAVTSVARPLNTSVRDVMLEAEERNWSPTIRALDPAKDPKASERFQHLLRTFNASDSKVRFSHDSISKNFSGDKKLEQLIDELKTGRKCPAELSPLVGYEFRKEFYVIMGNRRFFAYKECGINLEFKMILHSEDFMTLENQEEREAFRIKVLNAMTTKTEGLDIRVRSRSPRPRPQGTRRDGDVPRGGDVPCGSVGKHVLKHSVKVKPEPKPMPKRRPEKKAMPRPPQQTLAATVEVSRPTCAKAKAKPSMLVKEENPASVVKEEADWDS